MIPSEQIPSSDQASSTTEAEAKLKSAGQSRRVFLFKLSLLLNGAVGAILAVPIIGYLLGPAVKDGSSDNSWINLGPLSDFPEGETRLVNYRNPITTRWDGQTGDIPAWVRRVSGDTFQVFAINCAHLGCPVRWFAQSKLFMCPCHGGAYYEDGSRASGPPERGLFEYRYKLIGSSLAIHAGDMPTLATEASCSEAKRPLVEIQPATVEPKESSPRPRSSSWPA